MILRPVVCFLPWLISYSLVYANLLSEIAASIQRGGLISGLRARDTIDTIDARVRGWAHSGPRLVRRAGGDGASTSGSTPRWWDIKGKHQARKAQKMQQIEELRQVRQRAAEVATKERNRARQLALDKKQKEKREREALKPHEK